MSKTIINKDQLDSSVWTSTNLIAGKNISIIPLDEPIIDSNTVALYHFNDNKKDEITGVENSATAGTYTTGKFGKSVSGSTNWKFLILPQAISSESSYTVDFWVYPDISDLSRYPSGVNIGGDPSQVAYTKLYSLKPTSGSIIGEFSGNGKYHDSSLNYPDNYTFTPFNWHHIAYVNDVESNKVYLFLDGHKVYSSSIQVRPPSLAGLSEASSGTERYDEFRISNCVRWTEDFIPYSFPYARSTGETCYQIKNTQDVSDKQDKTLSTAITVDGTSQTTVEGALSAINTLAEDNKNPEGLYTSSNLVAGDNISITGSSPVANYTIVGAPTITDYVMSNISDSNYVNTGYIYSPISTWEAKLKFTMPSSNSDWRKITNSVTDYKGGHSLGITSGNKIQLEATLNGFSWGINLNGSTTLQFNTTYWTKYGWDGTTYYVDISTDGETYTREASTNNSSTIVATQPLIIGRAAAFSHYFTGSIDLASIEFYENNVLVYSGIKDTIKQINTDFTNVSGYSSSGTKVLETVDGTLTWATPQGGGSVTPTLRNYSNIIGTTLATGLTLSGFNAIMVFKNGMLLRESVLDSDSDLESDEEVNDYIISGNNLVFTLALESADTITIFAM